MLMVPGFMESYAFHRNEPLKKSQFETGTNLCFDVGREKDRLSGYKKGLWTKLYLIIPSFIKLHLERSETNLPKHRSGVAHKVCRKRENSNYCHRLTGEDRLR